MCGIDQDARSVMAYTVFERPVWRSPLPAVSISISGRIYLNVFATRHLYVCGAKSALLLHDQNQRRIAVRALTRKDPRAYCIDYHPNLRQADISAKRFLKQLGWDGQRYHLEATWNGRDSTLEFPSPDWENARLTSFPSEVRESKVR